MQICTFLKQCGLLYLYQLLTCLPYELLYMYTVRYMYINSLAACYLHISCKLASPSAEIAQSWFCDFFLLFRLSRVHRCHFIDVRQSALPKITTKIPYSLVWTHLHGPYWGEYGIKTTHCVAGLMYFPTPLRKTFGVFEVWFWFSRSSFSSRTFRSFSASLACSASRSRFN